MLGFIYSPLLRTRALYLIEMTLFSCVTNSTTNKTVVAGENFSTACNATSAESEAASGDLRLC